MVTITSKAAFDPKKFFFRWNFFLALFSLGMFFFMLAHFPIQICLELAVLIGGLIQTALLLFYFVCCYKGRPVCQLMC